MRVAPGETHVPAGTLAVPTQMRRPAFPFQMIRCPRRPPVLTLDVFARDSEITLIYVNDLALIDSRG